MDEIIAPYDMHFKTVLSNTIPSFTGLMSRNGVAIRQTYVRKYCLELE